MIGDAEKLVKLYFFYEFLPILPVIFESLKLILL